MAATLPGMPLAASDIFACKIDDGAPPAVRAVPGPAPTPPPLVWLVLTTCRHCNPRTGRYCNSHDMRPRRAGR